MELNSSTYTTTTTTSSSSSKRRRFQVPITHYFPSNDSAASPDGSTHFNYAAPTHSPVPALPHKVQSSLLTVGMRVRKSVPEGYKTETTVTKMGVFTSHANSSSATSQTRTPTTSTSYAELAPFCGVLKTGNFAVQTFPRAPTGPDQEMHHSHALDEEWDKGSIPSSSLESTDSFSSQTTIHQPTPGTNKRRFEPELADSDSDDKEDEYSSNFPRGFHQMWKSTIPFSTALPSSSHTPSSSSSRPILFPRQGRKIVSYQIHQQRQHKVRYYGEENHDPIVASMSEAPDFEEAEFLRRREEVDNDVLNKGMEVEMDVV
ncbi:hypothetical protein ACJ72_08268 [Emergomyces africanus]|uniref:Uncharacterized protein n=1 Tax=Emergomyces africanus TaxID=1955775 RepID=A0A1B7NKV0_9EURO|nr:hypothetical protein ACJ72_08268 [Emergomyces africanus]